jgi:diguanylate cyclase (GGDEF)-like protein
MPDFRSMDDVERCGRQVIRNAAQPIRIAGQELSVSLSVGVSIYPECGLTAEELLRNADAAMYTVKDSGRNSLQIFTESMMVARRNSA